MAGYSSILSSAKLVALCTLLSRVTGMLRDMLLAHNYGLVWVKDAFEFAFQVPNLFRRLFGEGALAAAFVPGFSRVLQNEGREAAWRLLARTLALLSTILIVVTIAAELGLLAIWLSLPADSSLREGVGFLQISLTAIMLPFMISICLLALLSSILNCVGSFVPPALASVVVNVVMIGGILWLGPLVGGDDPQQQIYGVAISVIAAGVLQLLFLWPALRAHGVPLGWRFEPRDPQLRSMLASVGPAMLGQGALLVSTFLDSLVCTLLTHKPDTPLVADWGLVRFTYPLAEGALSAITVAQRLYQFPLGVLVISIATVALPAFSRAAARSDWGEWGRSVRQMLRLALFEGVLAGVLMIVLAEPIVRLLFEYGRFTAEDTVRSAAVLRWYGLALWAFCAQHIVLRGFYSVGDVRTPVRISLVILPLNLALTLVLVWFEAVRESAFAISSLVSSGLGVLIGVWLLQRRVRIAVMDAGAWRSIGGMVIAAVAAGACVYFVRPLGGPALESLAGWTVLARVVDAIGWLAVGSGVFLLVAWLLRLEEVGWLLRLGARRETR